MYTFYLYVPRRRKLSRSRSSPFPVYPSSLPFFSTPIRIHYTYTFYVFVFLYPSLSSFLFTFSSTLLLYSPYVYIIRIYIMYTIYLYVLLIRSSYPFFFAPLMYTFYVYVLRIRAPRFAGRDWDGKKRETR